MRPTDSTQTGLRPLLLFAPLALMVALPACSGQRTRPEPVHLELSEPARTSRAETAGRRTLVIVLDGVPWEVAREVAAQELDGFADFAPPVPLVSSFPSTTSPALSGMFRPLGVAPAPGYEAHFYDREANETRGGGLFSYRKIDFEWRSFFDWRRTHLLQRAWTKLKRRGPVLELADGLEAFLASEEPIFFLYVALTDSAAHLRGPDELHAHLTAAEDLLEQARERSGVPFTTILVSDHGNAGGRPLDNVRAPLLDHLERHGWRLRDRLVDGRDVVYAALGIVSSVELHSQPEAAIVLARDAAQVEGIDLCVTFGAAFGSPAGPGSRSDESDDERRWRVVSERGEAEVLRRSTASGAPLYAYRPVAGDPLAYRPVLDELAKEASPELRADGLRFFPDRIWRDATFDEHYPDALHRIADSPRLVASPATVVCSCAPGFMNGSLRTSLAARLSVGRVQYTHGALEREASLGFLWTDAPDAPRGPVRYDEALLSFGLDDDIRGLSSPETGSP